MSGAHSAPAKFKSLFTNQFLQPMQLFVLCTAARLFALWRWKTFFWSFVWNVGGFHIRKCEEFICWKYLKGFCEKRKLEILSSPDSGFLSRRKSRVDIMHYPEPTLRSETRSLFSLHITQTQLTVDNYREYPAQRAFSPTRWEGTEFCVAYKART